jgi:hypothetical protein
VPLVEELPLRSLLPDMLMPGTSAASEADAVIDIDVGGLAPCDGGVEYVPLADDVAVIELVMECDDESLPDGAADPDAPTLPGGVDEVGLPVTELLELPDCALDILAPGVAVPLDVAVIDAVMECDDESLPDGGGVGDTDPDALALSDSVDDGLPVPEPLKLRELVPDAPPASVPVPTGDPVPLDVAVIDAVMELVDDDDRVTPGDSRGEHT